MDRNLQTKRLIHDPSESTSTKLDKSTLVPSSTRRSNPPRARQCMPQHCRSNAHAASCGGVHVFFPAAKYDIHKLLYAMSSSTFIQPKAVHASDQFKGNLQSLLHGGKSPAPFIMPDFRPQSSSSQPAPLNTFQNIVSQSPMPRVRLPASLSSISSRSPFSPHHSDERRGFYHPLPTSQCPAASCR